jgi:hypothetical protein
MIEPDATEMFGPIIYQDDYCYVRAKRKADGLHVYVHQRIDGAEFTPRGYMLGSNALIYKNHQGE